MALSADERETISDLIGAVRTFAAEVMTLHLQLGAVRTRLARKGTISDASAEEVVTLTSADAVFEELVPSEKSSVASLLCLWD